MKRKKEEEKQAKKSKVQTDRKSSKSPTLRLRLTSGNKNASSSSPSPSVGSNSGGGNQNHKKQNSKNGMNPKHIFTGYYGGDNNRTKLRRLVYDGALNVPKEASEIVHDTIETITSQVFGKSMSRKNIYDLPQVGSVLRPSEDQKLLSSWTLLTGSIGDYTTSSSSSDYEKNDKGGFLVTELCQSALGTTVVTNRRCVLKDIIHPNSMPRIRGGGEGENENEGDKEKEEDVKQDDQDQNGNIQQERELLTTENDEKDINNNAEPGTSIPTTTENDNSNSMDVDIEEKEEPEVAQKLDEEKQTKEIQGEKKEQQREQDLGGKEEHTQKEEKQESSSILTSTKDSQCSPNSDDLKTSNSTTPIPSQSASTSTEAKDIQNESKLEATSSEQTKEKVMEQAKTCETTPQQVPSTAATASKETTTNLTNQNKADTMPVDPNNSGDQASTKAEVKVEDKVLSSKDDSNSTPSKNATPLIVPLKEKVKAGTKETKENKDSSKGDQEPTTTPPSWYDPKSISRLEQTLLPEWFDKSANHRTRESYISTRERMINMARESVNKYVTGTEARRSVPGDAGSILRLHQFLLSWGFINGSAIGESAPTQRVSSSTGEAAVTYPSDEIVWSKDMVNVLLGSVASFATREQKQSEVSEQETAIDWNLVAQKVGKNVTAVACYHKFLSTDFETLEPTVVNQMDIDDATEITVDNDSKEEREDLTTQIIDGVRPSVAQAAIDSALQATAGNISETKKAGLLSSIASKAVERAKEEEDKVHSILEEILDQRMSKLENRLSLLDDLECMFDAERMALELERRDFYTLRCRQWFSGDS